MPPAQAMITHMTKVETQKMIADMKAGELLEFADSTDADVVVRCQMDGIKQKEGAGAALQKLCDADSVKTRAAVVKLEEDAKKKPETAKPTSPAQ